MTEYHESAATEPVPGPLLPSDQAPDLRCQVRYDDLRSAIKAGALAADGAVGILSTVRLSMTGGRLDIASFNYEHAIAVTVPVQSTTSDVEGTVCADPDRLLDAVTATDSDPVCLSGAGPVLTVWGDDFTVLIPTEPEHRYPALPRPERDTGRSPKRGPVPATLLSAAHRAASLYLTARSTAPGHLTFDIADGVAEVWAQAGPVTCVQAIELDHDAAPDGLEATVPAARWPALARQFAKTLGDWEASVATDEQGTWLHLRARYPFTGDPMATISTQLAHTPTVRPGLLRPQLDDPPICEARRNSDALDRLARGRGSAIELNDLIRKAPAGTIVDHQALRSALATLPRGPIRLALTESALLRLGGDGATAIVDLDRP